jgi:hypothetical protein
MLDLISRPNRGQVELSPIGWSPSAARAARDTKAWM